MPELLLPRRLLGLAPDVISVPAPFYWATPILLVLCAFLLVWEGPGVVRDFAISLNPVSVEDGNVQSGRCTTRKGVLTDCKAHLSYNYGGKDYQTDVEIMFFDLHVGDYETGIVISGDHPELATMDLGLDKLWNRIITLTLFVAALGAMSIAMIVLGLRIWRARRQLRDPAMLIPVPVEITGFDRKRKVLSVSYADTLAEDKTGRSVFTRMPKGSEPLIVGNSGGKPVGLAVRHAKAALPVLLDDRLMRIEMTDAERAEALLPFRHMVDGNGLLLVEAPRRTVSIWRRLQFLSASFSSS